MADVRLTPELEAFARACVAEGRYDSLDEVMRAALRLLQEQEEQRAAFRAMIEAAERDAEENGTVDAEEAIGDLRKELANGRRRRA
jgi:antitoxin ParD1/3/4